MDGSWDNIANALMKSQLGSQLDELDSLFSRFDQPPGGQYDGWYQYFDRDVRELLGDKVKQPFENAYCGKGKLNKCQKSIWKAIAKSGKEIAGRRRAPSNPKKWHSDANAERIKFGRALADDDDALHEPPERDPAGDLVQRPPSENE